MADDQIFVTCHILQVRACRSPPIVCILFNRAADGTAAQNAP
jgi:hypothetical protein